MKQMMNQVNPKAGTLKQTNGNRIQNASKKLIAFVLMLAIALQPSLASAASNDDNGDTCCKVEKKANVNFAKLIRIDLPSTENVKKADSEMNNNLYRSLKESKVKNFAKHFAANDAEINETFKVENSIKPVAAVNADDMINVLFNAEHIQMSNDAAAADNDMNVFFTVEEKGIDQGMNEASADEWMNIVFQSEHIMLPTAESFSIADAEINSLYQQEAAPKIAVK